MRWGSYAIIPKTNSSIALTLKLINLAQQNHLQQISCKAGKGILDNLNGILLHETMNNYEWSVPKESEKHNGVSLLLSVIKTIIKIILVLILPVLFSEIVRPLTVNGQ